MAEKDCVQPVGDIPDTEVADIPSEDSSVCVLDSVTLDNGQPTRFSKRKASPLYKTVAKRTTPSRSLTNMSKSTKSPSQLLLDAFKDPKFSQFHYTAYSFNDNAYC